ncbi:hypothetical protein A3850_012980 [Lewinella sp. 4G2]|nr:hypothetical protein A3850_012980 [Lewinella sp. 4G2]
MHRAIDLLTDQHPQVKALNALIAKRHGRYASVLTDIGFDHFLFLHWQDFGPEPFATFCTTTYHRILRQRPLMPEKAARFATGMVEGKWLRMYGTVAGMNDVFRRLKKRLSQPELLDGVDTLLVDHHAEFNQAFISLFPDLQTLADGYRPQTTDLSGPETDPLRPPA